MSDTSKNRNKRKELDTGEDTIVIAAAVRFDTKMLLINYLRLLNRLLNNQDHVKVR